MTRLRLRTLGALVSLATVTAACAGPPANPLDIGVKQFALDMVFEDEELAVPTPPEVIIEHVPAPPEVQEPDDLVRFESPELPPSTPPPPPHPTTSVPEVTEACPSAPPGASAGEPVTLNVAEPPTTGVYSRHNTGTLNITGGEVPLTLPYPSETQWDFGDPEVIDEAPVGGFGDPTEFVQYEVTKTVTDDFVLIDQLQLTEQAIELVRRTTITPAGEDVFEPSPPIDIYRFGVENDTWNSAGVDAESGTAMTYEATIEAREVVDVCGSLIDTYRVIADEDMVNLETGATTGTSSEDPNVYNVATQYGGLIVREDIHATTTTTADGATLVIEFDYVSTLDSIEPEPVP